MNKQTEALKLALDALEIEDMACRYEKEPIPEHIAKAITALREALAEQPAQQIADSPDDWSDWRVIPPQSQPAPMIRSDIRDGLVDDEPAQQEPGRNHWEDGDVFERIGAMKKQQAQQEPVTIGEPVGWHSRQYGFVYMALQPHQFEVGSTLCLKNGTPAWRIESSCSMTALISMSSLPHGTVFYTATPPQRTLVGLTNKDITEIFDEVPSAQDDPWWLRYARAIEAKLKEKNT